MVNGHTQGSTYSLLYIIMVKPLYLWEILFRLAANIPLPFIPSVDIQPLLSLKEKESFLNTAADQGYYLIFEHDYYIECCTVTRTEKGVRLDKSFELNQILS